MGMHYLIDGQDTHLMGTQYTPDGHTFPENGPHKSDEHTYLMDPHKK